MRKIFAVLLLPVVTTIPWLRKRGWRWFYQIFATVKPEDFSLMNYGYAGTTQIELDGSEEQERYSFQLYHHVAGTTDHHDHEILEVGCGRGGGTSYIKKYLKPKKIVGLDLSENAVRLCNARHSADGLTFVTGDAEALPFPEESFDAVVNIESAFCYPSREKFYNQVYRVLRDGGHFLYADIEKKDDMPALEDALRKIGFTFVRKEVINANVIRACDLDGIRRKAVIDSLYKFFVLRAIAYNFAAVPNSLIYKKLKSGEMQYSCYILKKSGKTPKA